jgi:tripartite-type tricarboxylate transporter receptor subunit TctC
MSPAKFFSVVLIAAGLIGTAHGVRAEAAEYFQGKTITIYVSNPPGGGYDFYTRQLARHLGDHIPGNPTVIVSNMPGGQGVTGANFLFNSAPRDGTALGALVQTLAQDQVLGILPTQYDARRFNWIGRIARPRQLLYVWHTVPVETVDDLRSRQTILAADSPPPVNYAHLLAAIMGARFKLVRGYSGTQAENLAMERGEVEAATTSLQALKAFQPQWLEQHQIRVILQFAPVRYPELAEVPAVMELAKTDQDKAATEFFTSPTLIGNAISAPPDVPPAVVATLRKGFDDTMQDAGFLDDCRRSKFDVDPLGAADLTQIVLRSVGISAAELDRARSIIGGDP